MNINVKRVLIIDAILLVLAVLIFASSYVFAEWTQRVNEIPQQTVPPGLVGPIGA